MGRYLCVVGFVLFYSWKKRLFCMGRSGLSNVDARHRQSFSMEAVPSQAGAGMSGDGPDCAFRWRGARRAVIGWNVLKSDVRPQMS